MLLKLFRNVKKDRKVFFKFSLTRGHYRGVQIDDTLLLIVYNLSIIKRKMVFNGILACLFTIFMVFLESVICACMDKPEGLGWKVKTNNDLLSFVLSRLYPSGDACESDSSVLFQTLESLISMIIV